MDKHKKEWAPKGERTHLILNHPFKYKCHFTDFLKRRIAKTVTERQKKSYLGNK